MCALRSDFSIYLKIIIFDNLMKFNPSAKKHNNPMPKLLLRTPVHFRGREYNPSDM